MSATYFLHPDDIAPDDTPRAPRLGRRAAIALILATAGLAGGVLAASHHNTGTRAQKPGPRRYPPAYWSGARRKTVGVGQDNDPIMPLSH